MSLEVNIELNSIVHKYCTNEFTLAQAVEAYNGVCVFEYGIGTVKPRAIFAQLGHKFTKDEIYQVEIGYDGNWDEFLSSKETVRNVTGFFQLFRDNYPQYKDEK